MSVFSDASELNSLIDARIKKILSSVKYLKKKVATVISYDNSGITVVNFPNDTTNVSVYNLSGQLLTVGDTVVVYLENGSNLSTGYILGDIKNTSSSISTAGTALPATTGIMTATMDSSIKSITPTGACTFNASGGLLGQECTFFITTSGTSSYVMTFNTNFKTVGTIATGTASNKIWSISFKYNGTYWVEMCRSTAAM
jgi:hypothetical protein